MAGLSGIYASVFIITAFLVCFSILALISISSVSQIKSIKESIINNNLEKIRVSGALRISSNKILVNLTNIGKSSIPVDNFELFDVIIVYKSNLTGAKVTKRLSFDPNRLSSSGWTIIGVTSSNKEELLNVIDLDDFSYGLWDPGETMCLEIWVDENFSSTLPVHVIISLPKGGKALFSV